MAAGVAEAVEGAGVDEVAGVAGGVWAIAATGTTRADETRDTTVKVASARCAEQINDFMDTTLSSSLINRIAVNRIKNKFDKLLRLNGHCQMYNISR